MTAVTSQALEQYAQAGAVATEVLSGIRTISALNAQPDAVERYRKHLFVAMKVLVLYVCGIVLDFLFFCCYGSYQVVYLLYIGYTSISPFRSVCARV